MPPLDRARFLYSLTGALLAGDWSPAAIRSVLHHPPLDRPLHLPRLSARLSALFPARPEFQALFDFLRTHAPLEHALDAKPPRPKPTATRLPRLTPPEMDAPPPALARAGILPLATEGSLAAFLQLHLRQLHWMADLSGRNRRHPAGPLRTYRHRWIPRREGPPRLLEIPRLPLKLLQQKILRELLGPVPAHPAAHGFRPGRSALSNALPHCGRDVVLRFDLVDFFPSVTAARVFRIFRTLGYPPRVARLLTGLCTTLTPADVFEGRPLIPYTTPNPAADFHARQRLSTRHLPQGAPTSPALANLAAHRLDRRLSGLAESLGAAYTRYADDLTFSGDAALAHAVPRLEPLVGAIAIEEGFALNHRKTRVLRAGARQHVTGITVNVHPNLPRAHFDRLKAVLTNCVRHGPATQNRAGHPDFRAHLAGHVARFESLHPARGGKLRGLFEQIRWPS